MYRKTTPPSLIARITLLAITTTVLVLLVTAFFLWWSMQQNSRHHLQSHMNAYIDTLIAATEIQDNAIIVTQNGLNLLGNLPHYWVIRRDQEVLAASPSLLGWEPGDTHHKGLFHFTFQNTPILATEKHVTFPGELKITYVFGMQQAIAKAYENESRSFFLSRLLWVLGGVGCAMAFLSWIQFRITRAPIAQLDQAMRDIEQGKQNQIEGDFPREIDQLVTSTNQLLARNQAIVTRYREFSGNLSHSLKTPLTVLYNDAKQKKNGLAATVLSKTELMLAVINRNLARTQHSPTQPIFGAHTDIHPVTEKMLRNFGKLYRDITYQLTCPKDASFPGDEHDFYEMLGNIIENAFKHAKTTLTVTVNTTTALSITVEDDGKGITETQQKTVLTRGIKLDQSTPGSGIGLAVAADIAALYQGKIEIGRSELGGAMVTVVIEARGRN